MLPRTTNIWKSSCCPRTEKKDTSRMLLNKIKTENLKFHYLSNGRKLKKKKSLEVQKLRLVKESLKWYIMYKAHITDSDQLLCKMSFCTLCFIWISPFSHCSLCSFPAAAVLRWKLVWIASSDIYTVPGRVGLPRSLPPLDATPDLTRIHFPLP